MSKYVVNGEEVSTKKEATEAAFSAVQDGEEVVLAPAPEEVEEETTEEEAPKKATKSSKKEPEAPKYRPTYPRVIL